MHMGENLAKAVGALGRRDCLMMDPRRLVVITDPNHVLFEEGAVEPLERDFVESLREGLIEPVICRRNGDALEVTCGRKRTRGAVEVGLDRIPVLISKGTDAEHFARMVKENEARKDPSTLTRARNVERAFRLGFSEQEVAAMFCKSVSTIRNLRAFLDLDPKVQEAIGAGKINFASTTKELSKLSREEQVKTLQTLIESGAATRGAAGDENVRSAARGKKPEAETVRMRSRKALERVLSKLPKGAEAGDIEDGIRDGIRFALGENPRSVKKEWQEQ